MQFDALTLAAVTDELRATIVGGRVQRVLLTSSSSIGLEIYAQRRRWQLLASAHPEYARVHLVDSRLSRGVDHATPLSLLLRKYVLGGRIMAVEQPALERILIISIAKEDDSRNSAALITDDALPDDDSALDDLDEDADETFFEREPREVIRCDLIIEPMERRSNIMLVDDNNVVLDSIKRVTPRMSRRVIQPRAIYEVPPVQRGKRDPRTATGAGMEALLETGQREVARALVTAYRGVSPQAAREVAQRALGKADALLTPDLPWYTLAARLRELWTAPPEPSLVYEVGEPQSYAPYLQTQFPDAQPVESMSKALELFYATREMLTAYGQQRAAVAQQLDTTRERFERQRKQLAAELERAQELDRLRWEGEMIFAYLHTLKPRQSTLEVEGQVIALDPQRSPVEEAQSRFRAYDKAKSAMTGLPERLRGIEAQLAGLDEFATLLDLADSYEQIEQITAEAEEQGFISNTDRQQRGKKRRPPRLKPLHLVSSNGFDIYVGRSAAQNVEVTFKIGRSDDTWLHVRGIPGSHVIIRTEGRAVPERTLEEAAGLAAYFSKLRTEGSVEIDLARRSVVRRIPGGPTGLVTYRAERTLRVAPLPPW